MTGCQILFAIWPELITQNRWHGTQILPQVLWPDPAAGECRRRQDSPLSSIRERIDDGELRLIYQYRRSCAGAGEPSRLRDRGDRAKGNTPYAGDCRATLITKFGESGRAVGLVGGTVTTCGISQNLVLRLVLQRQKKEPLVSSWLCVSILVSSWCGGGDLNPYALRR